MIEKIPYPKTYSEWVQLRAYVSGRGKKDSIRFGGSDIGSIMNVNPYKSKIEFFYECCDFTPVVTSKKLELLRGHVQEEVVMREYWRYWNPKQPTVEAFLDNWYGDKKVFRRAQKVNYIVLNSDYPHLAMNVDYQINRNDYNGKKKRGVLECKSPTWRAMEKWEGGLPPYYVLQPYCYMMVGEYDFAELFAVKDATYPEVWEFDPDQRIFNKILSETNDFAERVLEGKKIVYSNSLNINQKENLLADIAPEPTGDESWTQFLKEKHRPENAKVEVDGTPEQLEMVIGYLKNKVELEPLHKELELKEQKIRMMFTGDIGTISFAPYGKVSWKEKFNVPMRILKNFQES